MVVMSGMSTTSIAEPQSPTEQVFAVERAFARTMADRDLKAFSGFLSDEAVFFSGTTTLRGKQQITEAWAAYFAEPAPPFSWDPDQVVVLESGTLALSTGPVVDPSGKVVGRFNSIWRLEAPGVWKIVFDKGSPASPGPQ
jgi:ketosteroid isomerase-like protein